uniref:Uncharacterized protein n=1 Tax=Panagrolaimus sp. PS1159 TaxID=55785 RepID=A0AC35FWG6_9BILA
MGAFLSTLGFNQPFFFTILGILILLGATVALVQDGNNENGKDTRALLGSYRHKIDLHKPSPHPYSSDLNSTHIA